MMHNVVKGLVLILLPFAVLAQDAHLAAIRDTVPGIRQYADDHKEVRGCIPQITTARHELRVTRPQVAIAEMTSGRHPRCSVTRRPFPRNSASYDVRHASIDIL